MKRYIVKTKSNRRLIVTAKNEDEARLHVEAGTKNSCPWTGKENPCPGEAVEKVALIGTLIS
jgi:hypothetical protein|tara:strand:+ start:141 stop:326 length:186 start_codon:yes stop_codon:yes gene_type:complete